MLLVSMSQVKLQSQLLVLSLMSNLGFFSLVSSETRVEWDLKDLG